MRVAMTALFVVLGVCMDGGCGEEPRPSPSGNAKRTPAVRTTDLVREAALKYKLRGWSEGLVFVAINPGEQRREPTSKREEGPTGDDSRVVGGPIAGGPTELDPHLSSRGSLIDPSDWLLNAVRRSPLIVESFSECTGYPGGHVKSRKTGKDGVLVIIGPIQWLDENTVDVVVGHYRHMIGGGGGVYRLKRENGVWSVLGSVGPRWVS